MARRGRKPKGEFSGKTSNFSTRIQPETRKALEKEAKATGQSVSQFAERLIVAGLAERQDEKKDKALRALCFLIGEIARQVVVPIINAEKKVEGVIFDWRSRPFFYKAFKVAVCRVLDSLDPPGEAKCPITRVELGEPNPFMEKFAASLKSPEARGEYVAEYIVRSLKEAPNLSAEERETRRQYLNRLGIPSLLREFYGVSDAATDLTPKKYSGKTFKVEIPLGPLSTSEIPDD
jgi:hypothetical protein